MEMRDLEKEKLQKLKYYYSKLQKNRINKKAKNFDNENREENEKIDIIEYPNNLLKIIKGGHYYLLDRYKYDISSIMLILDKNKINKLHDFYKNYPEGIEKVLFIQKMKKEISYIITDPLDIVNLVYGLYKFFCEIDYNGDGHMQWEEFTQFIINTVEGDSDAKVQENEDDTQSRLFNEKKMFKYKRYNISTKLKDNITHKKEVNSAVFVSRADIIAINEYGTKVIKIYNPKTGRIQKTFDLEEYINPKQYSSLNDNKKKDIFIKKTKINTKNTIYSVLSMTQYQNIVAMCLSDKRIIFLHFPSDDRIEFIHEMHLPVLEKRIWYLKEHNIWVCSGCKLNNNKYYTLNELDIEFENYNQKYECLFNKNHPYRNHYCAEVNPHMDEIMDCIEIIKPMMIVTACLDGVIRLFNISNKEVIKTWNNHNLGVKSLDYNPLIEGVGYVLSVGFEYYINLYCIDLSIDEAYKGKLEGHYAPVISCKFIAHTYMAVSVDEEANVRIWDTKQRICLQLIGPPKKKFKINNLLGLFKYNKFMIYGNKIVYYDAKYKEEDNIESNQSKDDNYPIKIEYNYYYQQFFVATYKDIRVYSKDGQLYRIYKKLYINDHFDNNDVKIKTFIFENNYRKFYVGFSNGAILQFNAGNGSLIKHINEIEVERDGLQTYEYSHTKDISSLYFFKKEDSYKNLLLLSTSFDSLINIYNEDNPEESEKLRTIRGGHSINGKTHEILCMDFSYTLNLFATGGSDGVTVVWNFEMSKIDEVLLVNLSSSYKISVNFLKFLDPYSVLAIAYSDGTLYFWGVKKHKNEGECLLRARNYDKTMGRIDLCNIKYMNIYYGNIAGIKRDVPLEKFFDENSPFMNKGKNLNIQKSDNDNTNNNKKAISKNKNYNKKNKKKNENIEEEKNDNENEKEVNLDIVPDIYKDEIIDKYIDRDLYEKKNNIINSGVNSNEENKLQYYLMLGDEHGNIKIIDLMGFFYKNKTEPSPKAIIKSAFNLYKKDDINVSAIINHIIETRIEKNMPNFTNLYYKMLIKEFKAHYDEITCIAIITEPLSFVTCSKDEYVKIFNFQCECIGVINVLPKMSKFPEPEVKWNFKINEKNILEKEIKEVVNIFEKIGVESIRLGSKLDLELRDIKKEEKKPEIREKVKKIDNVNKKRFKPISKEEEVTSKKKATSEVGMNHITYEGFYVQNSQKKIEKLFNKEYPSVGIIEITNKLIGTIVDTEKENKLKIKEKWEKESNKKDVKEIETPEEKDKLLLSYTNINSANPTPTNTSGVNKNVVQKSNTTIDLKKIISNIKKNYFFSAIQKEEKNKNIFSLLSNKKESNVANADKSGNKDFYFFSQRVNSIDNLNQTNYVYRRKERLLSSKENSSVSKDNSEKYKNEKKFIKRRKEFVKIKKNMLSFQQKSNSHQKMIPSLKLRKIRKIKPSFRDELLTLRLFRKNNSKTLLDEIDSSKNDKTLCKLNNVKLPNLCDKIIFKKGETEKLLNYQFYSTSYRSCCETKVQSPINNAPLKTNYKNNWKYVRQFVEQKYRETERQKKKNNLLKNNDKTNELTERETQSNEFFSEKKSLSNNFFTGMTNYKTSLPSERRLVLNSPKSKY